MTCIVAIVTPKGAIMGADSAVSNVDIRLTMSNPKVRDFDGVLVGYSGSITVGRAIFRMIEKDQPTDIVAYIEQATLHKSMHHGSFLVIQNRVIWEIEAGAAISLQDHYAAIGSGMQYALGSLYLSAKNLKDAMNALNAAENYAPDVHGPMVFLTA